MAATTRTSWSLPLHAPGGSCDELRGRVVQLLQTEIDFVPNPEFPAGEEGGYELVDRALQEASQLTATGPAELPPHFRRMCTSQLLTREQEQALFREMNYLKFHANALRTRLDPDRPEPDLVAEIEARLATARAIRDYLIRANVRLVMSIVKGFATPQQPFDVIFSEGVFTLMQAVEKFDYERGFRFSTYAYRAIARSAYRTVTAARKRERRFALKGDEWAFQQADSRSERAASEQVGDTLREQVAAMLEKLDRRERFIIRSRYALGGHRRTRTLQFLADKLGISKERARQLEQRALGKLRKMAAELTTVDADDL